jgi:hypothetical protein
MWAKAGVMIRRTLDPGSPFAAVYITPGAGCRFQGRLALSSDHSSDSSVATDEERSITAPYWVRLERNTTDHSFKGYYSSDGVNWQAMAWNPQYIVMPAEVYIGLALTSHSINAICTAQFSDVKITGSVRPPNWTDEVVGTTMISNDAESIYVAVANSVGEPVVIYQDNPNAAQIDTWTEWIISLQALEDKGIVLTDVDSIAIGLGTKGNMTIPGGAGKMYIDEIRLYRSRTAAE